MTTVTKKTIIDRKMVVVNGVKKETVTTTTTYEGCTEEEFDKVTKSIEEMTSFTPRWLKDLFKGFDP